MSLGLVFTAMGRMAVFMLQTVFVDTACIMVILVVCRTLRLDGNRITPS